MRICAAAGVAIATATLPSISQNLRMPLPRRIQFHPLSAPAAYAAMNGATTRVLHALEKRRDPS
ncbi:hypothetical protein GCM10009095_06680 [Sphingomonas molluscorum]|nr:hypothetical protein GCM10017606_17130 [Microbacterium terregens]